MPTYPHKLWRQRKEQPSRRVDLAEVGRQVEGLWPILEAIEGPGFLLSDQVGLLLHGQLIKATKVANDRLKRLSDFGLLNTFRFARENQPGRGGSSPLVYCMTKAGAQLLAAYRQVSVSDLLWRDGQELLSTSSIFHRLDLADFHCALVMHCRTRNMALPQFRYEPKYPLPKGADSAGREIRPDAHVEIQGDGRQWSLLVEVDRNTERPKRFAERIGRYETFYRSGEWERWLVEAPTVLVIVTEGGRARAEALREATSAAMGALDARFRRYRFATLGELYVIGRSVGGYTAPVETYFERQVCFKPGSDEPVTLLGGGGAE